jgi:hypothetical protein
MGDIIKQIFKIVLKIGLIIVITPIAIVILTWGWLWYRHNCAISETMNSETFTKKKWDYPYGTKLEMYNDLKKNYLRNGMRMDELLSLLGETTTKRIYKKQQGTLECLQYRMGGVEWFFNTSFDLVICPDNSSTIVKTIQLLENNNDDGVLILDSNPK